MRKITATLRKTAAVVAAFLGVASFSGTGRMADTVSAAPVEMGAAATVRRSAAYLRDLSAFTLDVQAVVETCDDDDNVKREAESVHYEYRAPSGLFVDWHSNGVRRQLFSDGKNLSFFLPASATYVTFPEDGSASEALRAVNEDYGMVLPLPDSFLEAAGEASSETVQPARWLGRDAIAEVVTDHYLFRDDNADLEVWIDRGAHPLPRKILITTGEDGARSTFEALLHWVPNPSTAADRFTFVPPAGARQVEDADFDDDAVVSAARSFGDAARPITIRHRFRSSVGEGYRGSPSTRVHLSREFAAAPSHIWLSRFSSMGAPSLPTSGRVTLLAGSHRLHVRGTSSDASGGIQCGTSDAPSLSE